MSIEVTCPNGHVLRVKDKYAGKSGLCPHCQSEVYVPLTTSDDEILDILGDAEKPVEPDHALEDSAREHREESGISMLSRSILRMKVCVKCNQESPYWYATCPNCGEKLEG
jgi:ribosomal protein L40E